MIELNRCRGCLGADIRRRNPITLHDPAIFHVDVNNPNDRIPCPCFDSHRDIHVELVIVIVRLRVLRIPETALQPRSAARNPEMIHGLSGHKHECAQRDQPLMGVGKMNLFAPVPTLCKNIISIGTQKLAC
jgi:hypothetical protein